MSFDLSGFREGEAIDLAEHAEAMGDYYTPELRATLRKLRDEPVTPYVVTVVSVTLPRARASAKGRKR